MSRLGHAVCRVAVVAAGPSPDSLRVTGVIGWEEDPSGVHPPVAADCDGPPVPAARQLTLPLLAELPMGATASGLSWATWLLPSVPPSVRTLTLPDAVRALADTIGLAPACERGAA